MRFAPALIISLVLMGCPKQPADSPVPDAAAQPELVDQDIEAAPAAPEELTADELEERVNEAVAWLTTGQPEQAQQALAVLEELAIALPDLVEIPYNMGVAYEILGQEESARKRYLRATDVDPSLGEAWLNLGAISERSGDLDRALSAYQAGLRNDPGNTELVAGVIGVLRKQGKHEQAISEARAALSKNANNLNAYINLGLVYLDQGNLEMAQFIFQKAMADIDGAMQNALLHANLGQVFLRMDKPGNARQELETALELDKNLVIAKMFLAQLYMDNRDWEATAQVLEEAALLEPNNPAIQINLGIAMRGLGQYEASQKAYEKALELDPSNPDPYLNLAVLLSDHMKAYDAALEALETYQAQGGTRVELAAEWGEDILKQKSKYERAMERKRKREEAKKRSALAEQAAAREAEERAAEEAAAQAAQEAAEQAAQQELQSPPTAAPTIDGAGVDGLAPSEGESTEPGAALPEEPLPESAGSGAAEPGTQSASVGEILQAASAGGTIGAGAACTERGGCGSMALECASDGVCRDAGTSGTYAVGVGCSMDADCALGLACISQSCQDPAMLNAGEGAGTPTDDNPWGGE